MGGGCTVPIMSESLGAALLILTRLSMSALAYAAAVRGAGAVCCRHRFGFGDVGCTGHLMPPIASNQLPGALLRRFYHTGDEAQVALVTCLRTLALGP